MNARPSEGKQLLVRVTFARKRCRDDLGGDHGKRDAIAAKAHNGMGAAEARNPVDDRQAVAGIAEGCSPDIGGRTDLDSAKIAQFQRDA
ncbi:hypothetical protein, partial [Paracoccus sp. PAR01]|uniref:hypothetical protein n=1 Tax=Paracoccus sp. PAR01 TaxID=2769282 RepID=UPI001CE2118F